MACEIISNIGSFADLLVYPITCDYFFWLKIFLALMLIIGWGLFKVEERRKGEGDLLASMAVSSLTFAVLGVFGTLVQNSSGIAMIQTDVMIILFAIAIPLLLIWIFKK